MNSSLEAFKQILLNFWTPREDDEWPFTEWLNYCRSAPEQAQISLNHIRNVLDNPPANLQEVIVHNARISLPLPKTIGEAETEDVYKKWLANTFNRLEQILNSHLNSPYYTLTQFLTKCWLHQDEQGAFEKFRQLTKDDPTMPKQMLTNLQVLAREPLENLPELLKKWGWISLYNDEGEEYTDQQYVEWFRNMIVRLTEFMKGDER